MAGIRFKIGSQTGSFNDVNEGTRAFVNTLSTNIVENKRKEFVVNFPELKRDLQTAVREELFNGFAYARNSMIGTRSRGPETTFNFRENSNGDLRFTNNRSARFGPPMMGMTPVRWVDLSLSTTRRKKQNKGNFYLHTGDLRNKLKSSARAMVNNTGVVDVTLREKGRFTKVTTATKNVELASVFLRFLPKITGSDLPGLVSGDAGAYNKTMAFEKKLGISGDALAKLTGREGFHRPLLQPTITYWALYRLPNRVASVMSDVVSRKPR